MGNEVASSKRCNKCGIDKPFADYKSVPSHRDHLSYTCRDCERNYNREWAKKNRDKVEAYREKYKDRYTERKKETKKRYAEEHKEEQKLRFQRYWEKNKDRMHARAREYYIRTRADRKQKQSESNSRYRRNNLERFRQYAQRRYHIKRNLPATLTMDEWEYIKSVFEWTCCYCGAACDLDREHFIPVTKGGGYTLENILPACNSCNTSKFNNDFEDWYVNHKSYSYERYTKIKNHLESVKNMGGNVPAMKEIIDG
jgi:hypothetical protein